MKRKIAIPTQKGKLSKCISDDNLFNFFEVEDKRVVRVEQAVAEGNKDSYLTSLWLQSKNITELFVEEISEELKKFLKALGIDVKTKDELEGDDFFNQFVFS